jgi:hypothetical protein
MVLLPSLRSSLLSCPYLSFTGEQGNFPGWLVNAIAWQV